MKKKKVFMAKIMAAVLLGSTLGNVSYSGMGIAPGVVVVEAADDSDFHVSTSGVLTGYSGSDLDVVIPGDLGIVSIGSLFRNNENITSVVIPEGVTSIGDRTFEGCKNLAHVVLPSTLETIGKSAFRDCTALTEISFPERLNSIGEDAFYCASLSALKLPDSVVEIGEMAFTYNKIRSVDLGSGITTIGGWSLQGNLLTSVNIPSSVKTIGIAAFAENQITDVTIPEGVEFIGRCAYMDNRLREVHLPSSVKLDEEDHTEYDIFYCDTLEKITVDAENPWHSSEDGVLYDKERKTLISYPAAKAGKEFQVPSSVTCIGYGGFYGNAQLEQITLPAALQEIRNVAFSGCEKLAEITIPAGVAKLELDALLTDVRDGRKYALNLENIYVEDGNTVFQSVDGVLYSKDGKKLLVYPSGKKDASYRFPAELPVEEIGERAFSYSRVKNISFPSEIHVIGQGAFEDSSVVAVKLPDGLEEIFSHVFSDCYHLRHLSIPTSVTKIDAYAYENDYSEEYKELFDENEEFIPILNVYYAGTEEQWNSIVVWTGKTDEECTWLQNPFNENRIFKMFYNSSYDGGETDSDDGFDDVREDVVPNLTAYEDLAEPEEKGEVVPGLFKDYTYSTPVREDSIRLCANGGTVTQGTESRNYKSCTLYTSILPSYIYTKDTKGNVKTASGKVIAGITLTRGTEPPELEKGKIVDTEAAKIAKATIKNGQITVTAQGKAGTVYLWVMDTGDRLKSTVEATKKAAYACCPVNVRMIPSELQTYDTEDVTIGTTPKLTKTTLDLFDTADIYVCPVYKDGKDKKKTEEGTYSVEVDKNSQDYFVAVKTGPKKFTVYAKALKDNKATTGKVIIKCSQNGKKATVTVTAVNHVKRARLKKSSGQVAVDSTGNVEMTVSDKAKATGQVTVEMKKAGSKSSTTDAPKIYAMGAADGFDAAKFKAGKVEITTKPDGTQKKITATIAKDKTTLTITAPKGMVKGQTAFFLLVYNTNDTGEKKGYKVFSVKTV